MTKQQAVGDSGGLIFQHLRKLINLVDELRDVGLQQYINLPRIAVLGMQSSGKSSVLESIVGIDFLPRGEGVVTRRPLELRLVHLSDWNQKPWGVFEQIPNQKFFDFDKVRESIEGLTDKIAGQKKNIVNNPIVLTIYSPTCPDLTVIDLPGITRIPLAGSDQPKDIQRITRQMAEHYVGDQRTIILCVIPANADLTTSDALQMARALDPKGIRTVGVITKIDIMDAGTDARRMLTGQDVPLRLGYVGVKNRSQKDIIDKIRVKKALDAERDFFRNHPVYSTLPPEVLGCEVLTNKLMKVFFTHIRRLLPDIMRDVGQKIKQTETSLRELGPQMPTNQHEKIQLLWQMISEFCNTFKSTIGGKYDVSRGPKIQRQLTGGAKIKLLFYNFLKEFVGDYRVTKQYTDADIERVIINHEGDTIPGFPSADVFVSLISPQLERIKDPAINCVMDTYGYLQALASSIAGRVFQRFPSFISQIMEIVSSIMFREREKTREIVENIVDSEGGYLFTNDFDYIKNRTDLIPGLKNSDGSQNQQKPQQLDSTKLFVQEIRARIDTYFSLVIRSVRDSIPKAVGFFLVKKVQESMQIEMLSEINKRSKLIESLGEPPHVRHQREHLTKLLETMKKALRVLQRDPDLTSGGGLQQLDAQIEARSSMHSGAGSSSSSSSTPSTSSSSHNHHHHPNFEQRRPPQQSILPNKNSNPNMNPNYRGGGNQNMNRDFTNQQINNHQSMNPKMQQQGGSGPLGSGGPANAADPLRKGQPGLIPNGGGGAPQGVNPKGPQANNLFGPGQK